MPRVRTGAPASPDQPADGRAAPGIAEVEARFAAARAAGRAKRKARAHRPHTPGASAGFCACSHPSPTCCGAGPDQDQPTTEQRLGQGGKSVTPPPAETTDNPRSGQGKPKNKGNERRDEWHVLRDGIQRMTHDKSLTDCGRLPVPHAGGTVGVRYNGAKNRAGWTKLRTCRKVHLCPVCGNRIRTARGDQLAEAGKAWANPDFELPEEIKAVLGERGETGGGLAMGTYTIRHYRWQKLDALIKMQRKAWRYAFGAGAGKNWGKVKRRFGIVGDVRTFEVTWGSANGWHPHFHVVYFLRSPLTEAQRKELEELMYQRWAKAVDKAGGYTLSRKHGFRLDVPKNGDIEAFVRYIAKEMTGIQTKHGKNGRRTPWQIAQDYLDRGDPRDLDLWQDYEAATKGAWYMRWTDNLNDFAELFDPRDDDELGDSDETDEDGEKASGIDVLEVTLTAWFTAILCVPGRRLEVLHAIERGGLGTVRALLESWDLTWGIDVWSPLDDSAPPTEQPAAETPPRPADQLAFAC